MIKLNKQGFTLIELLVVIAIIGILASIVLVSLNDARNKGYDTQVKADVSQMRNAIEMCYDDSNGTYLGCASLSAPANANQITVPTPPTCSATYVLNDTATAWAVSGQLCSTTTNFFCIDSTGAAGTSANPLGVAITCP